MARPDDGCPTGGVVNPVPPALVEPKAPLQSSSQVLRNPATSFVCVVCVIIASLELNMMRPLLLILLPILLYGWFTPVDAARRQDQPEFLHTVIGRQSESAGAGP